MRTLSCGCNITNKRFYKTLKTLDIGIAPLDGVFGGINHKPVVKVGENLGWVAQAEKLSSTNEKVIKPFLRQV